MLKQSTDTDGYRVVTVWFLSGKRMAKVHRLVCAAFNGPCPPGLQCCHNDGNKTNNLPSNLRWGTAKENKADMIAHGRSHVTQGVGHPMAKLTEDDVRAIRSLAANRVMTQKAIAKKYGIVLSAVGNIVHRRRWKHLEA